MLGLELPREQLEQALLGEQRVAQLELSGRERRAEGIERLVGALGDGGLVQRERLAAGGELGGRARGGQVDRSSHALAFSPGAARLGAGRRDLGAGRATQGRRQRDPQRDAAAGDELTEAVALHRRDEARLGHAVAPDHGGAALPGADAGRRSLELGARTRGRGLERSQLAADLDTVVDRHQARERRAGEGGASPGIEPSSRGDDPRGAGQLELEARSGASVDALAGQGLERARDLDDLADLGLEALGRDDVVVGQHRLGGDRAPHRRDVGPARVDLGVGDPHAQPPLAGDLDLLPQRAVDVDVAIAGAAAARDQEIERRVARQQHLRAVAVRPGDVHVGLGDREGGSAIDRAARRGARRVEASTAWRLGRAIGGCRGGVRLRWGQGE